MTKFGEKASVNFFVSSSDFHHYYFKNHYDLVKKILPPFRPKWLILVFRKSPFSVNISKSTNCMAVNFNRTQVYHYDAFTSKI